MTPTADDRERLRRLLDERIPAGGTEADTRFTDTELDEILTDAPNVHAAAAEGWRRKAAMIARELGPVASTRAGDAEVQSVSVRDAVAYCLQMADMYDAIGRQKANGAGRALALEPPDVLGCAESGGWS